MDWKCKLTSRKFWAWLIAYIIGAGLTDSEGVK